MSDEEIHAATIGEPTLHNGPIELAPYDPSWPKHFAHASERIRSALGEAIAVHHVGSTSVPGLAAKPIIDVVLVVPDSADEGAYVPGLEAIGYHLRIREPDWYEHRLLLRKEPTVHVHVFSQGCPEIERMLAFRNRLRSSDADAHLYDRTKRDLAGRTWRYVQDYADAKTDVVEEIMARVRESRLPRSTDDST